MIRRVLREPLLHFLLGGAAIFLLYEGMGPEPAVPRDAIVVDEPAIRRLASSFRQTWMRPPTRAELEGLIEDHVREEILYREALALGLDRDDLVVRRRMRQKMEFLNEDLAAPPPPDEAELRAYLKERAERYRIPTRTSFRQVFLDPQRSSQGGPAPAARARGLLETLAGAPGEAADDLGDPTLLPPRMVRATPRELEATFGDAFAEALSDAPEGRWSGPVASAFGLHLVHVSERAPARAPELDEVRPEVARDLEAERRREANERVYRAMRERYRVEIHMPEKGPDAAVAASGGG